MRASLCAHLLHRIYTGRSKLCQRTRAKGGGGKERDGSATDRGILLLCTNVIRVAATNNGRSQYGNRSGFYGLPNRRIEASSIRRYSFRESECQQCGHVGPPQYAERRPLAAIEQYHARQIAHAPEPPLSSFSGFPVAEVLPTPPRASALARRAGRRASCARRT